MAGILSASMESCLVGTHDGTLFCSTVELWNCHTQVVIVSKKIHFTLKITAYTKLSKGLLYKRYYSDDFNQLINTIIN